MDGELSPWRADGEFVLLGVELQEADFSGLNPRHFEIGVGSRLVHCDFRGLKPVGWPTFGSGKQPTTYVECSFDGMSIKGGGAGRANFINCSFRDVMIQDYRFTDAQLVDCNFSGRLRSVIFSAIPNNVDAELGRARNEFKGNDFSEVAEYDVEFRGGIDLDLQTLPRDPGYLVIRDAATTLGKAWQEIQRWPENRDRSRAETNIEVMLYAVHQGQQALFVTRKSLSHGLSAHSATNLIDLLQSGR